MAFRTALHLCFATGALFGFSHTAAAQHIVYNNAGPFIAWWSQVEAGAAEGPEGGDEITLANGGRDLMQLDLWYHVGGQSKIGYATIRTRLYLNDGPDDAPETMIWDSGPRPDIPHISGRNHLVFAVPNVTVPDRFTWTAQFTNRSGSTPAPMGLRIYDPPIVGQSDSHFIWVRTSSGAFTRADFGGITPANLGITLTVVGNAIFRRCCLSDGSCVAATVSDCFAVGGAPGQDFCTSPCPPSGACCFADAFCLELTELGCTSAGGLWQGPATQCATAPCTGHLYINGSLATGKIRAGLHAPHDTYWSDIYTVGGCGAQLIGHPAHAADGRRHADDFTIPPGAAWEIDAIYIYSFVNGGSSLASPIEGATLRIWRGKPGESNSQVVWGDTSTNILSDSSFSRIFKIATSFPIFRNRLEVGTILTEGHYWIDYSLVRADTSPLYAPFVTIPNQLGKPGANALASSDGGTLWTPVLDDPHPAASCSPVPQDFPFSIIGIEVDPPGCYANCDQSTLEPILNVDDFTCFINEFATALTLPPEEQVTHYANCDHSTTIPVLNVDDFTCFINAFANGCD